MSEKTPRHDPRIEPQTPPSQGISKYVLPSSEPETRRALPLDPQATPRPSSRPPLAPPFGPATYGPTGTPAGMPAMGILTGTQQHRAFRGVGLSPKEIADVADGRARDAQRAAAVTRPDMPAAAMRSPALSERDVVLEAVRARLAEQEAKHRDELVSLAGRMSGMERAIDAANERRALLSGQLSAVTQETSGVQVQQAGDMAAVAIAFAGLSGVVTDALAKFTDSAAKTEAIAAKTALDIDAVKKQQTMVVVATPEGLAKAVPASLVAAESSVRTEVKQQAMESKADKQALWIKLVGAFVAAMTILDQLLKHWPVH